MTSAPRDGAARTGADERRAVRRRSIRRNDAINLLGAGIALSTAAASAIGAVLSVRTDDIGGLVFTSLAAVFLLIMDSRVRAAR